VARQPSARSAVLGSQVVIETGEPTAIPLGDWVADLLVVADASDADLAELPPAEARRVLAPYRGMAVVGGPRDGGRALSVDALRAWAEKTGGTVTISDDDTGCWAVVRMAPLEGGDDWSHHMHGADGDLVSNDRVFGAAPFALQWTGKPYAGGNWDIHVVSAGRMFTAQSSVYQHGDLPYELVARSVYNGQVLWRRPIDRDFGESGSYVIARPDMLYLKDKNHVLLLDPETGAEKGRVEASADAAKQCLLLLEAEGVLVALTGPVQHYSDDAQDYNLSPAKLRAQGETNDLNVGGELTAWSSRDGKPLWRFAQPRIDPSKVAIAGGRVYLYADRAFAACLELKTGDLLWKTAAPIADPKGPGMGYVSGHATVKTLSMFRNGAIATTDAYVINYLPHRQSQAFAAGDGHSLWDKMNGPSGDDPKQGSELADTRMLQSPVLIGTALLEREDYRHPSGEFDLASGNAIAGGSHFNYGGCGRFTGVASGLLIGQCGEILQLASKQRILDWNAKSTCGTGQFVADGLLLKVASTCSGCCEWRGFFAACSAPQREPRAGRRLETGTATATTAACDGADWRTYRGDDTRKSSSTATIAPTAVVRWTFAPQTRPFSLGDGGQYLLPDVVSTQPIAVGDRVWIGTADGAVVCLDRATGAERWRYWTAGRMWSSPSWSAGRIYAGSSDGWVHCVDAATGALVWRYRLAPEERRVMVLGRLSSAWPILANVVVEDGTVYAVGGLVGQFGGSELCALDATTGALRWSRHNDISAAGQLAWYAGRLWWHTGDRGLQIVDPATGEVRLATGPAGVNWGQARGQDLGILPGGIVVFGGRQFNLPIGVRDQAASTCGFLRADADGPPKDAQGKPLVGIAKLSRVHDVDAIPVWDDHEVLLFGKPAGYQQAPLPVLLCRDLGKALSTLIDDRTAAPAKDGKGPPCEWSSDFVPAAEQAHAAFAVDYAHNVYPRMTAALAGNAVVFYFDTTLFAVSRSDAKALWRIKLPGPAMANGLSLTRAGDVLVALKDGRVVCIGAPDPGAIDPATASPYGAPAAAIASSGAIGSPARPVPVPRLPGAHAAGDGSASWSGVAPLPAPFSKRDAGALTLGWRDDGLYGVIQVAQAQVEVDEQHPWTKDCVEIWFETDCARFVEMTENAFQVIFAPKPSTGAGTCVVLVPQGRLPPETITATWKPTADGYRIEFFIPARELQVNMAGGARWGFNYAVDQRGKAVEQFFSDKGVDNGYGNPSTWGEIILTP
jgi:outer membrane protein assembly factor BamB